MRDNFPIKKSGSSTVFLLVPLLGAVAGVSLWLWKKWNGPERRMLLEVRAAIRSAVSSPEEIQVQVVGDCVILRGPVLKNEFRPLLAAVYSVDGVHDLSDRLELRNPIDPSVIQG